MGRCTWCSRPPLAHTRFADSWNNISGGLLAPWRSIQGGIEVYNQRIIKKMVRFCEGMIKNFPAIFENPHELYFIELDYGKNSRKALYLMVKTHGFPVNFPLHQSSEYWFIKSDQLPPAARDCGQHSMAAGHSDRAEGRGAVGSWLRSCHWRSLKKFSGRSFFFGLQAKESQKWNTQILC